MQAAPRISGKTPPLFILLQRLFDEFQRLRTGLRSFASRHFPLRGFDGFLDERQVVAVGFLPYLEVRQREIELLGDCASAGCLVFDIRLLEEGTGLLKMRLEICQRGHIHGADCAAAEDEGSEEAGKDGWLHGCETLTDGNKNKWQTCC